jgi:bloom syndrome protein
LLPTPQTPRQTPRPEPKNSGIEAVDLTADDEVDVTASRSSSTEAFGDSHVLWREDSASRAEPLERTSKKRKSDGISSGTTSKSKERSRKTIVISNSSRDNSPDDFKDVDDYMLSQTDSKPIRANSGRPVRRTVEDTTSDDELGQHKFTETTDRIETLTRHSHFPTTVPRRGSNNSHISDLSTKRPSDGQERGQSNIQVAASPTPSSTPTTAVAAAKLTRRRPVQQTIIQDSDDEDGVELELTPVKVVKSSPAAGEGSKNWQLLPRFSIKVGATQDVKPSVSRTGSPLRPLSQSVTNRRDQAISPSQRKPQVHLETPSKRPFRSSGLQSSSSTATASDRELLKFFLKHSLALQTYRQRLDNLLAENSIISMNYMDDGERPPAAVQEQRESLLLKLKSYDNLKKFGQSYRTLVGDRKMLHQEISALLEDDEDTTSAEERMTNLSSDIKSIEVEILQALHLSGAVNDGYGTIQDTDIKQAPPTASKATEFAPSGQSSGQVILQTQFPTIPPRASSSSIKNARECLRQSSPRNRILPRSLDFDDPGSPSPIRQSACPVSHHEQNLKSNQTSYQSRIPPPNFLQSASPMNYGYDDEDDEALNNLLEDEQQLSEHMMNHATTTAASEDDFGEFDDEDLLEVTQHVETRQDRAKSSSRQYETPRNASTSSRMPDNHSRAEANKSTMYTTMDPAHASMMKHPWSADVKKALRDRFGLRGFRQNQLEAINATLGGKDAFILMPTGGGKSLCYQLPAVVQSGKTRGVTLVISPLLSLMSDQVDHLKARNIQACLISGDTSKEERSIVFAALEERKPEQYIQLLYVTPEMVANSRKLESTLDKLHRIQRLARIVIDEAHCVSQWGHDFRPDYKSLSKLRDRYRGVPFIALTATATETVKLDCIHNLGMTNCEQYKQSFNRPNLYYEVRSKKGKGVSGEVLQNMSELILKDYKNMSGIVYTLSRKGCEDLAEKLRENGIRAHHFHASMDAVEKHQVQRDWQAGKHQVVVATIAFGMGIDKADVRFVIHHTMPKSLEGYYQETGRAGRDGKPSGCYLYYGYQDTAVLRRFIEDSEGGPEVKQSQSAMLNRMVQFCENRSECRRVEVLAYFGERFSKENCNHSCDACNSDAVFEPKDVTSEVKAVIKIVKALRRENVTLLYLVDLLRGANTVKTRESGHAELDGFGAAKDSLKANELQRLFVRLLIEGVLDEYSIMSRSGFAQSYIKVH